MPRLVSPRKQREQQRSHLPLLFGVGLSVTVCVFLFFRLFTSSSSSATSTSAFAAKQQSSSFAFLRPISEVLGTGAEGLNDGLPKNKGWMGPVKDRFTRQRKAARASAPPIVVRGSSPELAGLDKTLARAWTDAFRELEDAALERMTAIKGRIDQVEGVMGTGVKDDEEAMEVQEWLDCTASQGHWVHDEKADKRKAEGGVKGLTVHKQDGIFASCDAKYYNAKAHNHKHDSEPLATEGKEWDVRSSLKWVWVPSPDCKPPRSMKLAPKPLTRRGFCNYMAHKSLLLVGDVPQYSLHDLVLDFASTAPQTCYGDLYCKEHSLCGDVLGSRADVEAWKGDERVYRQLPDPPGLKKSVPTREKKGAAAPKQAAPPLKVLEKRAAVPVEATAAKDAETTTLVAPEKRQLAKKPRSPSYGTVLRFRRSDGLNPVGRSAAPVFIHSKTGVREINQHWIGDAKRSDITVLTKPPLPLTKREMNTTWDMLMHKARKGGSPGAQIILEEAVRVTREVWLPELIDTLKNVRAIQQWKDQLVIYRGGWRSHPDCGLEAFAPRTKADPWSMTWDSPGDGPPPHLSQPMLRDIFFGSRDSASSASGLSDLPTLYYNLQTMLQNHIARYIVLPRFAVPYLDTESMLSVWRSGMVGGSAAAPFDPFLSSNSFVDQSSSYSANHGQSIGLRNPASGDCTRYCLPSPGMAVETAFLGGLWNLFQVGWGADEERLERWVGDGFVTVRHKKNKKVVAGEEEPAAATAAVDTGDDAPPPEGDVD